MGKQKMVNVDISVMNVKRVLVNYCLQQNV